jgi:magnesium-transporting ATPase (P-type)
MYDNIRRFLQFQLTVNIVALTTNFIGSVVMRESPLKVSQLLWVNLIMAYLAALALVTELPTNELL